MPSVEERLAVLETTVAGGFGQLRSDLAAVLQRMGDRDARLEAEQARLREDVDRLMLDHAARCGRSDEDRAAVTRLAAQLAQITGRLDEVAVIAARVEALAGHVAALAPRLGDIDARLRQLETALLQGSGALTQETKRLDAVAKRVGTLGARVERIEPVVRAVAWLGGAFATLVVALLWAIVTGKVTLNFL